MTTARVKGLWIPSSPPRHCLCLLCPLCPASLSYLGSGIHLIYIRQYSRALLASEVFKCHCNGSSRVTPCACELSFQAHGEKGLRFFLEKQFVLMAFMIRWLICRPDLHKGPWICLFLTLYPAGFSCSIPVSSYTHCSSVIYNCLSKTNNIYRPSEIINELLKQCSLCICHSEPEPGEGSDRQYGRNGKMLGRSRKIGSLEQK